MANFKLKDGDELEIAGTKFRVIDGDVIEVDERSPIEIRMDDLEERVQRLENNPYAPYIYPPPTTPYIPWTTTPYIGDPGTTDGTPNTDPIRWTTSCDTDFDSGSIIAES